MITTQIHRSGEIHIFHSGTINKTDKYVSEQRKSNLNALRNQNRLSERMKVRKRMELYGGEVSEAMLSFT